MPSNINSAIPPFGNPTTAGVRANFEAARQEIEILQRQIGFADYNDAATAVTPINVAPSTWTKLTNNTLGAATKTDALPVGVTSVWNAITNQLALTELPINTMIEVRKDITVTTTAANQIVKQRTKLAISDPIEFTLNPGEYQFKTAGLHDLVTNTFFYIGSEPVRLNPGEFQIWSDAAATVVVKGWYIRIIKWLGD